MTCSPLAVTRTSQWLNVSGPAELKASLPHSQRAAICREIQHGKKDEALWPDKPPHNVRRSQVECRSGTESGPEGGNGCRDCGRRGGGPGRHEVPIPRQHDSRPEHDYKAKETLIKAKETRI
jgi:hypothetical protein